MRNIPNTPVYVIDDDYDADTVRRSTAPPQLHSLHPTPLIGVCVSIFSSLLWGLYPVLCRYIMLRESGRPQSTALLAVLMTINSSLTGGYYLLRPSNMNNNSDCKPQYNKLHVACMYGLLCLARMQTNMASTRMTRAYNTQMTAMSLPFFTAFLAWIFLYEKIHSALLPALLLMLLGGFLVFYGQGAFNTTNDGGNTFTTDDLFGVLLQLISVIFSAGVKIAFKSTEGILDKTELLLSQFVMSALPLVPYALIFESHSVHALLFELDSNGIMCMVGLAFGIYIVGNVTQIYAARSIGASNHAASNSMRLVSAVLGSALILNEPLNKPVEWVGMALIIASILGYWYIRNMKESCRTADTEINADNLREIDDQNLGVEMSMRRSGNKSEGGDVHIVYNPLISGEELNDCRDTSIDVSRHA